MDIYRRISGLVEREQLGDIASELDDRFGRPPVQASNLLMLVGFRLRAAALGIERGEAKKGGSLTVDFGASQLPSKEAVAALAAAFEGRISFETGDGLRMVIGREVEAREPVPKETSDTVSAAARDFEKILNLLESFAI
jgi:transcription-repair coupling factor (superfamily II helicase)